MAWATVMTTAVGKREASAASLNHLVDCSLLFNSFIELEVDATKAFLTGPSSFAAEFTTDFAVIAMAVKESV